MSTPMRKREQHWQWCKERNIDIWNTPLNPNEIDVVRLGKPGGYYPKMGAYTKTKKSLDKRSDI